MGSRCAAASLPDSASSLATLPRAVNGRQGLAHVLLRHRLLRDPEGFERLGVIPEELLEEDQAVAHREHIRQLDVRPRTLTDPTPDLPHDDPVTYLDEIADGF